MCGRYYFDPDQMTDAELIALLNREKERSASLQKDMRLTVGEIHPGDHAAVIARNRRNQRSAFVMHWGYRLNGRLVFNARSESAGEKPLFRSSMQDRRCLIPASAYFEWDHREKPLKKYRFAIPEEKMLYLAGLYRYEENAAVPSFTILTREATPDIFCFHARMPVIIPAALSDDWLDRSQPPEPVIHQAFTSVCWESAI